MRRPAGITNELIPPGESQDIETIIRCSMALLSVRQCPVPRGQHGKAHGCVKATFEILADIPSDLRVGVFAASRNYEALVRFSNGSRADDRQGDVRGMAIKLLGGNSDRGNHDIVLMSYPSFFSSDARSGRQLAETMAATVINSSDRWLFWMRPGSSRRSMWIAFRHFVWRRRFAELMNLVEAMKCRPRNPLAIDYWSATPYALGSLAVKYRAKSLCSRECPSEAKVGTPNMLQEAMKETLAQNDVEFEIGVQVQTDSVTMPVENAAVVWDESRSPFVPVARLRVLKQQFDSPPQMDACERLEFTPARAPEVHRPLGGINRVRCRTYGILAAARHGLSESVALEPCSWAEFDQKAAEASVSNAASHSNQPSVWELSSNSSEVRPARMHLRKWANRALLAMAAIYVATIPFVSWLNARYFRAPLMKPNGAMVTMPQGVADDWSVSGLRWYAHASQGTMIMPYRWFVALEQPELSVPPFSAPPFTASSYLERFGFISSYSHDEYNPNGVLPIGFAIERNFDDPVGGFGGQDVVGLTCAACHTGQLTYSKPGGELVSLRINGGSSAINIRSFQDALGASVFLTLRDPFRLHRFKRHVLEDKCGSEADRQLTEQLESWLQEARRQRDQADKQYVNVLEAGPGRTDALALIGNRVFGGMGADKPQRSEASLKTDAATNENLQMASAPVNYPPLWDTSWFDWVQYNGSIRMVMVRNIGEALGVGARTNTDPKSDRFLDSSVNVANLHLIEDFLGGDEPFAGLRPPRWEDAVEAAGFPQLDAKMVERGRQLYRSLCVKCHLAIPDELAMEYSNSQSRYWTAPDLPAPNDKRFMKLRRIPLNRIGTDPSQAVNFAFRRATVPNVEDGDAPVSLTASSGLRLITERIRGKAYRAIRPSDWVVWDRFRNHIESLPDDQVVESPLAYRPRPHNGIWATPPYLHNGSVPTLRQLLSPVEYRDDWFSIGSNLYDVNDVGLADRKNKKYFRFDTKLSGNRNTGHEFRNLTLMELEAAFGIHDTSGALSKEERWALLAGMSINDFAQLSDEQRISVQRRMTEAVLRVRDAAGDNESVEPAKEYAARSLGGDRANWVANYASLTAEFRKQVRMRAFGVTATEESLEGVAVVVAPSVGDSSFPGVIGPLLTDGERSDLIEFMKSL